MRCGKARDWLSLAADSQLPPDKTLSLENHLEQCDDCGAYKDDLQLGRRLLKATQPGLSENFDWRLQLKLNQTLKEAAGEAAFPWQGSARSALRWWRSLGWSALAGAAAILLVGLLVLPPGGSMRPILMADGSRDGARLEPVESSLTGNQTFADRTQFSLNANSGLRGLSPGRTVSTRPAGSFTAANRYGAQRSINRQGLFSSASYGKLRQENQRLQGLVVDLQLELKIMKAQLDSSHLVIQHPQRKDD